MLIVMKAQATEADIDRVRERIESLGFRAHIMPGAQKDRHRNYGKSEAGRSGGVRGDAGRGRGDSRFEAL